MSTPYPPQPRRLMRDPSKKLIGGVCSGLAKYLNMDVTLVRILTVVISLFTGVPIVLYLIALFVMPEEGSHPAAAAVRERSAAGRLRRRLPRTEPPAAVRCSGAAAGRPGVGSRWCSVGAAPDRTGTTAAAATPQAWTQPSAPEPTVVEPPNPTEHDHQHRAHQHRLRHRSGHAGGGADGAAVG